MSGKKQRLELTWVGKDEAPKLEPRILLRDDDKSYGDKSENMLIKGDNLLALKALEQEYAGKVKCVYIDPPYNTGNAFEHYDDGLEHSIWLSLMHERLLILRGLLSSDGFICCQIDDSEGQYLKVLMDEVFGRNNYLATFYVRVRYPDKTLKQDMKFHKEIEQIHIYRKEYGAEPNLNKVGYSYEKFNIRIEEKGSGVETIIGGKRAILFQKNEYEILACDGNEDGLKEVWASGTILDGNSSGRFFRDYLAGRYEDDGYGILYKIYGIGDDKFDYRYFTGPNKIGATKGKYYQGVPKSVLESESETFKTTPINNFYDLAANFGNCRTEGNADFRGGKKPEVLLEMILKYFSNVNDLILDSFLGSGTTAAVAHKMGRRWIGIEMGEHCDTHCLPRLKAVVDGSDMGGISKSVGWSGGGGFAYYSLAPSLIRIDEFGQAVIDERYNADMLAAAMARHEGFIYSPDAKLYWKQGVANDTDYIYTTTGHITPSMLDTLADGLKEGESLVVCAKSFDEGCKGRSKKITLKKIPQAVMDKCEYKPDGYPLNIVNPPIFDDEEEE